MLELDHLIKIYNELFDMINKLSWSIDDKSSI